MNAPAGEENPNENCDEEIKKRVEGLLEPTREKHQRETTKKNLTGQNNEDKNETEEDVEEVVLFSRDVCFYGQQPSPWDRFSQWVHSICLVTFDVELGQTIEMVYPGNAYLDPVERTNICYMSFPDSNAHSSSRLETAYHFALKRHATTTPSANDVRTERAMRLAPAPIRPYPDHLHGFVHFRQHRDPSKPRGFYQKSLVLITRLPIFGLFMHVIRQLASAFFASGEPAIETACQQIDQWPTPEPGVLLQLPLLGELLQCRLPSSRDVPQRQLSSSKANGYHKKVIGHGQQTHLFASSIRRMTVSAPKSVFYIPTEAEQNNEEEVCDCDEEDYWCVTKSSPAVVPSPSIAIRLSASLDTIVFYESLRLMIPHAHLLWELVLTGQSLIVVAPTPAACSRIVQSLVALIWPLRCYVDTRPVFCLHDTDLNDLISSNTISTSRSPGERKRPPIKTAILGVTNPLLVKAFAHWPTILKVTASSWEEGSLDRRKLTLLARGGGSMGQLVAEVAAPIIVAATAGGGGGAAAPVKQLHTRLLAAAAASLRRNRSLPREARNSSGIELKLNNNNYEFGSSVEDNDENRVEIEKQHKQKPIKLRRIGTSAASTLETKSSGLFTDYRPFLEPPDKQMLRRLLHQQQDEDLVGADNAMAAAALRRHFLDLTQSFMLPLERYFATLLPATSSGDNSDADNAAFYMPARCKRFVIGDFFASLSQQHQPIGTASRSSVPPVMHSDVRGDWNGLYRKFVNSASPNFRGWLRQHTAEANATLYEGYVDALCRMDVAKGIFNGQHTQVEVVDFVLRLVKALTHCLTEETSAEDAEEVEPVGEVSSERRAPVLRRQLRRLLDSVDEDLRQLLESNRAVRSAVATIPAST